MLPPVLLKENISLRPISLSDEKEIFIIRSDERVSRYLLRPLYKSTDEAVAFINKIRKGFENDGWYYWGISVDNNSSIAGTICLWKFNENRTTAEIGYELMPAFQGKGIMHKAVSAVIDFAFLTLKVQTLMAEVDPENIASIRLLTKNEFVFLKTISEDTVVYQLVNSKQATV